MIEIPESFAHTKLVGAEPAARAWLAALPELVEDLLREWSCAPDGPILHGEVGIVVPVRHRDLPPAVLKVSCPHPGDLAEPEALAAWNGDGAVRMFERDDERRAMLLERAHGTLADIADADRAVAIQGELARRLAVDAPATLPRLADLTRRWADEMITTAAVLGNPLPRRTLDAALATLREFAGDRSAALVHGDLHDANVLAADREPWLAIDPKACSGDPAFNALYVIFSPRFGELLGAANPGPAIARLLEIFCEAGEFDLERARGLTGAGAVREALWSRRHGEPGRLIRAADTLAEVLCR